jgi:hypothetical protein
VDDGRAGSSALGGYPAEAERAEGEPVDFPPELAAGESADDALAADDGVLHTESRDGESLDG